MVSRSRTTIQIKTARIEICEKNGSLTKRQAEAITEKLEEMEGVVSVTSSTKVMPNEIIVHFRLSTVALRDIIEEIHEMGFRTATYTPDVEKNDIRMMLSKEVIKYRNKFFASFAVLLPILVLMWVIPYTVPEFMTAFILLNGMPLYIFLLLGFSSIIQFVMGANFYKGALKSVKNCSANMDVLVVLGTTAAWLYGVILIIVGDHEITIKRGEDHEEHVRHAIHEHAHNFEISASLITVILLGKFLESYSKKQTVDKLSQLASLKVTKAMLVYKTQGVGHI